MSNECDRVVMFGSEEKDEMGNPLFWCVEKDGERINSFSSKAWGNYRAKQKAMQKVRELIAIIKRPYVPGPTRYNPDKHGMDVKVRTPKGIIGTVIRVYEEQNARAVGGWLVCDIELPDQTMLKSVDVCGLTVEKGE